MRNSNCPTIFLLFSLLVSLCGQVCIPTASAQWIEIADLVSPLVDGEPFDLLYLNKNGENAILKILPLKDPLSDLVPERGMLIFEFANDSGEQFQVPYASVESHDTFNEILIEEANRWLAERKYSLAFRNLLFVYDHGGKQDEKLVESLRNCLFLDATDNFREKRFELSLSIFEDVYSRNPDFKVKGIDSKLIDIILLCYDGIIQKDFDAAEYFTVQRKVATVGEKYESAAKPLVDKWNKAFVTKANQLMKSARDYAAQGQGRLAHLASRQAEQINPGREEIKLLQAEILKQYPLIVIGTSQPGASADGQRIEHWGSRRVGRLTQRTIMELTGLTDEGGKYSFLNGTFTQSDEIGLEYLFELAPESSLFGAPPADAFLVSSRLLAAASEDSPLYDPNWRKILASVEIKNENQVLITLKMPFVRPEALLNIPYVLPPDEQELETVSVGNQTIANSMDSVDQGPLQNGVYVATESNGDLTTFELNPKIEPVPGLQHPVLIEQLFPSASVAVEELIKGNIDVVDRIPIADIQKLKSEKGVVVRPYILPSVHMLVPKIRGELADNPYFRSGLSHAIDRETLIAESICAGQDVSGCESISGPFPIGTEENDQISYGYDLKIRPPNFNTKLAMVLIEISLLPNKDRPEKLKPPSLVLAHPSSSSATQAAEAIARMWSAVGVNTTTLALKADESFPSNDLWDFLYLEVTVEEPLTDVTKLFGRNGYVHDVSAPAEQTMRALSYADSWRTACASLRRLHRQLSTDLSIVPLWQVKEHYAYRNTVRGVGRDLIHLYQNVERWQIETYGSDEKE